MISGLVRFFGDELDYDVPRGGYHIWVKLPQQFRDNEFGEMAIRHGVVIVPGSIYGADPGFVRLTYASSPEAEIEEGIRRLHDASRDAT